MAGWEKAGILLISYVGGGKGQGAAQLLSFHDVFVEFSRSVHVEGLMV